MGDPTAFSWKRSARHGWHGYTELLPSRSKNTYVEIAGEAGGAGEAGEAGGEENR